MSKKAEGFSLRFVLINTGNISRKVLSKVLRSFDKNFERLQRNKKILDEVKKVTYKNLTDILKELDRELVRGALSGEHFREYFFHDCKNESLADCVKEIID